MSSLPGDRANAGRSARQLRKHLELVVRHVSVAVDPDSARRPVPGCPSAGARRLPSGRKHGRKPARDRDLPRLARSRASRRELRCRRGAPRPAPDIRGPPCCPVPDRRSRTTRRGAWPVTAKRASDFPSAVCHHRLSASSASASCKVCSRSRQRACRHRRSRSPRAPTMAAERLARRDRSATPVLPGIH